MVGCKRSASPYNSLGRGKAAAYLVGSELGEKICQLQTHRLKGKALQCELLRFGHNCRAQLGVSQQVKRDRRNFVDTPAFAAGFLECDSFNRPIAADANG